MSISVSEAGYIRSGLLENARSDGRGRLDFRPLSLARGVARAANGSARCKLGGTDVLAACRLEVEEGESALDVFVECTPAALATLDNDISASLASHLRALFARPLAGNKQLIILPHRRAWVISLDVTILSADGGNVLDAASCAARYALADLRIPRTRPVGFTSKTGRAKTDGMAALLKSGAAKQAKGKGKAADFELESYYDEGDALQGADDLPISVTLNMLGDSFFVDATLPEERCTPSRLVIGADAKERIRLIRQEGELELEADLIESLLDVAAPMARDLIESLNAQREAG